MFEGWAVMGLLKHKLMGLSLHRRLLLVFMVYLFASIALIMGFSLRLFVNARTNSVQEIAMRNVRQANAYIDEVAKNLMYISQQMSYPGTIGSQLYALNTKEDAFGRMSAMEQIDAYVRLITFTNPRIGLVIYFNEQSGQPVFSNMPQRSGFFEFGGPVLFEVNELAYYGPHISQSRFDMDDVLSLVRKVDLMGVDYVHVYIEESFSLDMHRFDSSDFPIDSFFAIVNSDGYVNYSQLDRYAPGDRFDTGGGQEGAEAGYRWFSAKADAGWETVVFVPDREFLAARNEWFWQVAVAVSLTLFLALFLPLVIWQILYKPMRFLDMEVRMLMEGSHDKVVSTGIPEADRLLNQAQRLRGQNLELIEQIKLKEKQRADVEIEKLVYQINPHFLMNTLNTVHWLAMKNGQPEIDRVTSSLNKLLHYNLGKEPTTDLRKEVQIVQEYIAIQRNRYSFSFEIRVEVPDELLDTPVPRFILQPLCENAISHGIDDGGTLGLGVHLSDDGGAVIVSVKDDGKGMPQGACFSQSAGMGIGIRYVKGMLDSYYGDRASMEIASVEGQGTDVRLYLPI